MKTVLIENTWLGGYMKHGWGNGYILIPEGHPMHGKDYDDIEVDVHGGLTFSQLVDEDMLTEWDCEHNLTKEDIGCWMIGFDTAHYSDTPVNWPKERVQEEAERLKEQLMNMSVTNRI